MYANQLKRVKKNYNFQKKIMSKFEALKIILQEYYKKNPSLNRKHFFDKFIDLGAPKRSLNGWLSLLEKKKSISRKAGSGRVAKIATKANIVKIKKTFSHRSGRSQRKVARKFNISQRYVSTILNKYTDVKYRKKTKRPLLSDRQRRAARPKCRKLLEDYRHDDFILDDESYFTKSHTTLAGNDGFYSDNLSITPDNVKNKYKSKFEEKVLVYIAISARGVSAPLFFKSGLAINQYVYKEECLTKRLIPFVRKHHRDDQYVFWPDLASSHYATSVQQHLQTEKIRFVPKNRNPANVPKVRPIEDFWGLLKQKVYENDWTAKNIPQLIKRIKWCITKIDTKLIQKTCKSVHTRLDREARYGIESL